MDKQYINLDVESRIQIIQVTFSFGGEYDPQPSSSVHSLCGYTSKYISFI